MPGELRDLGRTVELHRPRRGRAVAVLLAVAVIGGAVAARASDDLDESLTEGLLTAPSQQQAADADAAPAATAEPAAPLAGSDQLAPVPTPPLLGRVGGLLLHVPAARIELVSYHEASFAEALAIAPVGQLTGNGNPTRYDDPGDDPDGIDYHIQVSRGRANGATSAVDVVLPDGEPVRSPVAGTVVEVRDYDLYGRYEDVRLELRPDTSPQQAVVLIHIEGVTVRAGDRVEVGDVLASNARKFPFSAVVDRQTAPDQFGHVHLEVKQPTP